MIEAFQTLTDRENPEYVRKNGPFICTDERAWLHDGYYFWDEDITLAHFWGKSKLRKKYIICKTYYNLNERCWDLYGKFKHRQELIKIYKGIKNRNINSGKPIKFREIIEELISKNLMKYEAIRAEGTLSIAKHNRFHLSILLEERMVNHDAVRHMLNLRPAIQLCFFNKNSLERDNFEIVYPQAYTEEEMVF